MQDTCILHIQVFAPRSTAVMVQAETPPPRPTVAAGGAGGALSPAGEVALEVCKDHLMTTSGDIDDAYAGKKLRTALGTEEGNVKTTVAEYLVAGVLRAEEGFSSFRAAAEHDVDLNLVARAHGEASTEASPQPRDPEGVERLCGWLDEHCDLGAPGKNEAAAKALNETLGVQTEEDLYAVSDEMWGEEDLAIEH